MRSRTRIHSRNFIRLAYFIAGSVFLCPARGQQIASVVSAANNQPVISPNSLASIYGLNLSAGTGAGQLNASGELPLNLDGTSVTVAGKPAQLVYVSPQQINFLVPANTPLGNASVSVNSSVSLPGASQQGGSVTAHVALVSPGIFTIPCVRPSRAAALNGVTYAMEPFQAVTSANAIADKRTRLSLFGTGLRYAGNASQDPGVTNVAGAVTAQATDSLGVTRPLTVEYAGPAPNFFGLDQVNVVIPPELDGSGLVNVQLQAGNTPSNTVSFVMSPSLAAGLGAGQNFNITTVAGTGAAGDTGNGGAATQASLAAPGGVALDANHNLYIASAADHVVRAVAPDGTIRNFAGIGVAGSSGDGGPAAQAELDTPVSVAADASGNVYIADPAANRVRMVAPDGTITTFAGTGTAGFSGDGGPAASAQLSAPSAVAIDPYGALVIADTGNNRIRRVTSDGVIDTLAGTGAASFSGDGGAAYLAALSGPDSVAVGGDGTVYAADEGNLRVRRIAPDGSISSLMSSSLTPLTFEGPMRVALDANQQLWVSEGRNASIQAMGAACQLNTVAGTGVAGFSGDGGSAVSAQLSGPASLAPDPAGDMYVADASNNRVRKLYQGDCDSPAGIFFNPQPAMSGMTVNGEVRLSCPAAQNTALALSANGGGLILPGSVNIAQGQSNGTFSFEAPGVAAPAGFAMTASNPRYSASGTAYAEPDGGGSPSVLSVALTPNAQTAGGPVTGVVTLASPAPAGGTQVAIASSNPAAQVAGTAFVPAGHTRAEFTVQTKPVAQATNATISANSGGASGSASFAIAPGPNGSGTTPSGTNPTSALATIGSLAIAPASVSAGQSATGTITLASAAPGGGAQVNLSSNSPAAGVPASVTVPAGFSTANFPVTPSAVSSPATATITASSENQASATVTVNPASGQTGGSQTGQTATIASVSISPSSVNAGQSATGTVTLAAAAPSGGVTVGLGSNNAAASVPASVAVAAGQTTATFPVTTSTVSSPTTATITAASANSAAASMTVNPASSSDCVGSVTFSRSEVVGGNNVNGTVTLQKPAPAIGQPVSLASSSASASVPSQVTVPAGQTSTGFTVATTPVLSTENPLITAGTGACANSSAGLMVLPLSSL